MLRRAFFAGLAATFAGAVAGVLTYLWPGRRALGQFDAGVASSFAIGEVRHFQADTGDGFAGRSLRYFHLVRRPDGFVAFWHRCTHRGCTVPFREEFEMPGIRGPDGQPAGRGLFRCPCHGSTFSRDEAEVVFGPAPRPLDVLPVRIDRAHVLVTVREGAERQRKRGEAAPAVGDPSSTR